MKKRKVAQASAVKPVKHQPEEKPKASVSAEFDDDEEENGGFGKWLRTGEGVELMKYFVIFNSIGVFMTLGWPTISKTFFTIRSFFFDDDEFL